MEETVVQRLRNFWAHSPRLPWIGLGLSVLCIAAVAAGLFFSRAVDHIYAGALASDREWAARQRNYFELSRLASEVNTASAAILESGDAVRESARLQAARFAFDAQLDRLRKELQANAAPEEAARMLHDFAAIRSSMSAVYAEAEAIVRDVSSAQPAVAETAAEAKLASARAALEALTLHTAAEQDRRVGEQAAALATLDLMQLAVGFLIFTSAVVLVVYGWDLQRRGLVEEQNRNRYTDELETESAELRRAKGRAEEFNMSRNAFLADLAPELRTPLDAVIGHSAVLHEEAAAHGEAAAARDLLRINSAGKQLQTLVNNLLDLSRIEAGKIELHAKPFDVAGLVEEVAAQAEVVADQNGNRIEVSCARNLGFVHSDVVRTRQVLANLMNNACKFTENGVISLRVMRIASEGGDFLEYSVTDCGAGMDAAQVSSLFKPFVRPDFPPLRKNHGGGLGLAISRRLSQMLGGDISLVSEPGQGSTFTLVLPAVLDPGAASAAPQPVLRTFRPGVRTARPVAPSPAHTVLVIDDNDASRELLSGFLKREGLNVVGCNSGRESLQLARVLRPSAITMDVLLHDMDGWELLAAFKADPDLYQIPVTIVSVEDDRSRAFTSGSADFMLKPVNPEVLANTLRRYHGDSTMAHILVVEDDPACRDLTRGMLESGGYSVGEARNAVQALERLRQEAFDLVLLDLLTPEMDGFEFVRAVNGDDRLRDIPVIVFSPRDITPGERQRLSAHVARVLQQGDADAESVLAGVAAALASRIAPAEVASLVA